MFSKNLRYYRLKKSMNKKQLAIRCGLSPMAITNYENGKREPNMEILKKLADALDVRVTDFLAARNENLVFEHGEFRKKASLSKSKQEYVKESVEDYLGRLYTVEEILGGEVIPKAPECHAINMTGDIEKDANTLRKHLGLAEEGPVNDLIAVLENKGILVFMCDLKDNGFSGMNGFVNGRPYIVVNGNMNPERIRSTAAHELAHLMFKWPEETEDKKTEKIATAVSGSFLFPKSDVIRELGIHRSRITKDMTIVSREYGISMQLLVIRAAQTGIISEETKASFFRMIDPVRGRTKELSRIEPEKPTLFEQLVYRAVSENEISIQRGAELLGVSYNEVLTNCQFNED